MRRRCGQINVSSKRIAVSLFRTDFSVPVNTINLLQFLSCWVWRQDFPVGTGIPAQSCWNFNSHCHRKLNGKRRPWSYDSIRKQKKAFAGFEPGIFHKKPNNFPNELNRNPNALRFATPGKLALDPDSMGNRIWIQNSASTELQAAELPSNHPQLSLQY